MESYQPIYDAVRSKISGCDASRAIADAVGGAGFSHVAEMALRAIEDVRQEYTWPSVVYRPRLSIDGNQWCALYGDNIQDGVAGFGDSPANAMADFNNAWWCKLPTEGGAA